MWLIFLTPSLIGSIYGGVYHLTNWQVVLMGVNHSKLTLCLLTRSFQFVQVILKVHVFVPYCIKFLILDVFIFPCVLESSLISCCYFWTILIRLAPFGSMPSNTESPGIWDMKRKKWDLHMGVPSVRSWHMNIIMCCSNSTGTLANYCRDRHSLIIERGRSCCKISHAYIICSITFFSTSFFASFCKLWPIILFICSWKFI